ncbi:phosphate permease [bacterium 3DAC]|nr:inorganic phosphate transporter [Dictyoglomota bacterium]UZN22694.1 phosphate permease [bacterium 3DAC]
MHFLLILGFAIGFLMAVAIGANDAANSMATAVGAKAITPRQAILIAGVLEFVGATFFGKQVTETIRKGIVDPAKLSSSDIVVIGSMAALLGAAIWIFLATKYGLPVSTTHSIVGGMIGYGIAAAGWSVVNWDKVITVTISWVLSPIVGLIFAFVMFKLLSALILHSDDPVKSTKIWAPVFISSAFVIIGFSFGFKVMHVSSWADASIYGVGFGVVALVGSIWYVLSILKKAQGDEYKKVEEVFRMAQVFTSSYVALAHGANDVANAIAPVAAIYIALQTGKVTATATIPRYILAIGGLGIALGVWLFGRKVMTTVGEKLTELTNTRGFVIDFSTATVVLGASNFGMPISTTHTVVGSVLGVGFARGVGSVNLGLLLEIVASWFFTVPAAAVVSYIFFYILKFIFL